MQQSDTDGHEKMDAPRSSARLDWYTLWSASLPLGGSCTESGHRSDYEIPLKNMAHHLCLVLIDDEIVDSRRHTLTEGRPPIHQPFFFDAAILSRMRSPVTSRSNCAKESRTFNTKRPMEVVV